MTHVETISALMTEIKGFQNVILAHENEILKRRIEIAEILVSVQTAACPAVEPEDAPIFPKLTVPFMLRSILPELNGSVFWYPDLAAKAIQKYPQFAAKITRGVHEACYHLKEKGLLVESDGGFSAPHEN